MSDGLSGFANARFLSALGEMTDAAVHRREAEAELERTQRLIAELRESDDACASNLAEKHALRAALAKVVPNHPLLVNKSLQERIRNAGVTAMRVANSWDAASEAGRTFKYDDTQVSG